MIQPQKNAPTTKYKIDEHPDINILGEFVEKARTFKGTKHCWYWADAHKSQWAITIQCPMKEGPIQWWMHKTTREEGEKMVWFYKTDDLTVTYVQMLLALGEPNPLEQLGNAKQRNDVHTQFFSSDDEPGKPASLSDSLKTKRKQSIDYAQAMQPSVSVTPPPQPKPGDPGFARLLQGRLKSKPIAGLLKTIAQSESTGRLCVDSPAGKTIVQFGLGLPVHASSPVNIGAEALMDLFIQDDGEISFDMDVQPETVSIQESLEQLLLQGFHYAEASELFRKYGIDGSSILQRSPGRLTEEELETRLFKGVTHAIKLQKEVYSNIYGTMSLDEVAAKLSIGRSRCFAIAFNLMRLGLLLAPDGQTVTIEATGMPPGTQFGGPSTPAPAAYEPPPPPVFKPNASPGMWGANQSANRTQPLMPPTFIFGGAQSQGASVAAGSGSTNSGAQPQAVAPHSPGQSSPNSSNQLNSSSPPPFPQGSTPLAAGGQQPLPQGPLFGEQSVPPNSQVVPQFGSGQQPPPGPLVGEQSILPGGQVQPVPPQFGIGQQARSSGPLFGEQTVPPAQQATPSLQLSAKPPAQPGQFGGVQQTSQQQPVPLSGEQRAVPPSTQQPPQFGSGQSMPPPFPVGGTNQQMPPPFQLGVSQQSTPSPEQFPGRQQPMPSPEHSAGQQPLSPEQFAAGQQPLSPEQFAAGQQPLSPEQFAAGQQPMSPEQFAAGQQPLSPEQFAAGQQPLSPEQFVAGQQPLSLEQLGGGQQQMPSEQFGGEQRGQLSSAPQSIPRFGQTSGEYPAQPTDSDIQAGDPTLPPDKAAWEALGRIAGEVQLKPTEDAPIDDGTVWTKVGMSERPVSMSESSYGSVLSLLLNEDSGILTFDALQFFLYREFARAYRFQLTFSLVLFSVKTTAFDRLPSKDLVHLLSLLNLTKREVDLLGHFGDNSFAIVVLGADSTQCGALVDRIVTDLPRYLPDLMQHNPTLHFGIATIPNDAIDLESLISAAQMAMTEAVKQSVTCIHFGAINPNSTEG